MNGYGHSVSDSRKTFTCSFSLVKQVVLITSYPSNNIHSLNYLICQREEEVIIKRFFRHKQTFAPRYILFFLPTEEMVLFGDCTKCKACFILHFLRTWLCTEYQILKKHLFVRNCADHITALILLSVKEKLLSKTFQDIFFLSEQICSSKIAQSASVINRRVLLI